MDSKYRVGEGGRGFVHHELRDHKYAVLEELATQYATEGVELDFAAAPGGGPLHFREEDAQEYTPVMTEWVRKVSGMVRGRPGTPGQVGARVYPTEAMNLKQGLDVRTWLKEGLLDYAVPMLYWFFILDPNMPFDWLVEAAHDADTSVYGMLQPYLRDEGTGAPENVYASPDQTRAAAASFWDRGVDGLYTWFMRWPLGDAQRRTLTELGDPDLIKEGTKHYVLARRTEPSEMMGYPVSLPVEIPAEDPGKRYEVPIYIADDIEGDSERIRQVRLILNVSNLVSADSLTLLLNGRSMADETCVRDYGDPISPYAGQLLDLELEDVRPRKGQNTLEISLESRPGGMEGGVTVNDVEVLVEYGPYPSGV
jgi:hypothetical protein